MRVVSITVQRQVIMTLVYPHVIRGRGLEDLLVLRLVHCHLGALACTLLLLIVALV